MPSRYAMLCYAKQGSAVGGGLSATAPWRRSSSADKGRLSDKGWFRWSSKDQGGGTGGGSWGRSSMSLLRRSGSRSTAGSPAPERTRRSSNSAVSLWRRRISLQEGLDSLSAPEPAHMRITDASLHASALGPPANMGAAQPMGKGTPGSLVYISRKHLSDKPNSKQNHNNNNNNHKYIYIYI